MLENGARHETVRLWVDRETVDRLAAFLSACAALCEREGKKILKMEVLLDDRLEDIQTLREKASMLLEVLETLMRGAGVSGPMAEATANGRARRRNPVALHLEMNHKPKGGGWLVWIDFAENALVLQDQVGRFLEFIAGGEPTKRGDIVAYRTRDELLEYLKKTKCKAKDPSRYITVLVNKLRTALAHAKYDPALVQRDAADGVRFALRRPATTVDPGIRLASVPAGDETPSA